MTLPAFTTEAKVNLRLSKPGVSQRTDHATDGLVMADVISNATSDVGSFLCGRYAAADLAASTVVQDWTADVAVWHLCRVRANPIPASVQKRYEWVMERLEAVQEGKVTIPDIANPATAPAALNYREAFDQYPPKRRVGGRSEPRSAGTGYPQSPDYREPPRW